MNNSKERTDAAAALGLDDGRLRKLALVPVDASNDEIKLMAEQLLRYRREPRHPDVFGDVGAFHSKFNLPRHPAVKPAIQAVEIMQYRENFLREEVTEFSEAWVADKSYEDTVDALVDLVYVALGTMHFMGAPFNEHWREVQRANMDKVKGDMGKARTAALPGIGEAFEVAKPPGWKGPDHGRVLRDFLYVHHDRTFP